MSIVQYNVMQQLTAVRLAATSNQSGSYYNGPLNNGVGATFTYATGSLSIDSVVVNQNDRILFNSQSSGLQNGIYVCIQQGATGVAAILQRSNDFQNVEQMLHPGMFCPIGAGSSNGGKIAVYVEPIPAQIGVSSISFVIS